jgi:hypothetical protein
MSYQKFKAGLVAKFEAIFEKKTNIAPNIA